ncbi:MAG: hypothetical protein II490_04685, partial [Oscillospiraceae bacterium]|nr:hypothetical protein [Oscillospiraceae bacterium]
IREAKEIAAFREAIRPAECKTLLVRRDSLHAGEKYGNSADDDVENFKYDLTFNNDLPLDESKREFTKLITDIIEGRRS